MSDTITKDGDLTRGTPLTEIGDFWESWKSVDFHDLRGTSTSKPEAKSRADAALSDSETFSDITITISN